MKTRTAVLLLCIGAVIAAIVLVAKFWPSLPKRTTPRPVTVTVMPMAGETVEMAKAGCLAPMIAELRKRPNWSLRIDDMRWTDYTQPPDDPKHAQIVIDASGATWRSEWIPAQTLPLTDDETREVLAAFDRSCEIDESIQSHGYEGRYINVAYDRAGPAAARLHYRSPVVTRLGEMFEAIRARYVANRAGATKQFKITMNGWFRDGAKGTPNEFRKHTVTIEAAHTESDEERVDFVDWAMSLPSTLPAGRKVATGTVTVDGVTKPIAMSLDSNAPENLVLTRHANELSTWMSIMRE